MPSNEAHNLEEITIGLNAYEVEALMVLLLFGSLLDKIPPHHTRHIKSIVDKLGPGIYAQAMKQVQLKRDSFN